MRNHPSIISYEGFNSIGITVSTGVLQAHLGSASTEDRWVDNLSPQEVETLAQLHVRRYIDFCSKFIRLVDEVDNSRLVCLTRSGALHLCMIHSFRALFNTRICLCLP